jgi:hypothetical protein
MFGKSKDDNANCLPPYNSLSSRQQQNRPSLCRPTRFPPSVAGTPMF